MYICAVRRLRHTLSSDDKKQFHTRILMGGTAATNLYDNIYTTRNHVNQRMTIDRYVERWSKVSHVSIWECVSRDIVGEQTLDYSCHRLHLAVGARTHTDGDPLC